MATSQSKNQGGGERQDPINLFHNIVYRVRFNKKAPAEAYEGTNQYGQYWIHNVVCLNVTGQDDRINVGGDLAFFANPDLQDLFAIEGLIQNSVADIRPFKEGKANMYEVTYVDGPRVTPAHEQPADDPSPGTRAAQNREQQNQGQQNGQGQQRFCPGCGVNISHMNPDAAQCTTCAAKQHRESQQDRTDPEPDPPPPEEETTWDGITVTALDEAEVLLTHAYSIAVSARRRILKNASFDAGQIGTDARTVFIYLKERGWVPSAADVKVMREGGA